MQEQTKKIATTPDKALQGGKVRPKSKVQVLFRNSKHHGGKPYHLSMVHPALADKLIEQGKAEIFEGELSKSQLEENATYQKENAKGTKKESKVKVEDEFDDDLMDTKTTKKK